MLPSGDFQAEVLSRMAEQLCHEFPDLNNTRAASIAAEILERAERRDAARAGVEITPKLIRARLDCFIFLRLIVEGWGEARRLPSGAIVAVNSPLMFDERLNFPKRSRLAAASKRVRQTCPEEAKRYKQAWRDWREARNRYLATETEESWQWYTTGEYFRNRRLFRYTLHELLPRMQERERARRELQEATSTMTEAREQIFEAMGVPSALRSYA